MRRSTGLVAFLGLLAWGACSSDPDVPVDVAAARNQPGDDFLGGDDGLSGAAGDSNGQQSCLGETRAAEAIGLDIYVMLDSSGSMNDAILPPPGSFARENTKWTAVRAALSTFVRAPETEGIGVGLQFFPQITEGVPGACNTNADCGPAGGACTSSYCVQTDVVQELGPNARYISALNVDVLACLDDSECPGNESCRPILGRCVLQPGVIAQVPQGSPQPLGPDAPAICATDGDCVNLPQTVCERTGVCRDLINGQPALCTQSFGCPAGNECVFGADVCTEQTHCAVEDYATPAVPITSGPTRAAEITSALASRLPSSLTPTGPALEGALEHAKLWSADHPDRQVVTVLATDGFPQGLCTPTDIPGIAAIAANGNAGNQPVRTFVIGVFATADLAEGRREDLDQIARAGGSDEAIVINTAGDVTQDFLEALNRIRDTSVSCDFQLTGTSLDFDQVNLEVVDDQGSADLLNVGDESACADDDGWFYQRDAAGTPKQIRVCPSTCQRFTTGGVTANLQIGCATRIR